MRKIIALYLLSSSLVILFSPLNALAIERVDFIIRGGTVVTMDGNSRVIENGAVAIRGERIVAVGTSAEIARQFTAARIINASGKAVMPGLINTHTHVPMGLFRGIADDLILSEWLTKFIFPAEAKNVDEEFVRWGTRLGCLEMIKGGTTTYVDMYYFEDAIADETVKAGMRGVLGETVIDFPVPDNKTWDAAMRYTERFIKKWKGHTLITPAIAPHAPYTVSTEHLKQTNALSEKYGVPLVIHVAEAPTETEDIKKRYNATPAAYLESIGLLSNRTIAAHSVWLSDEDIKTFAAREVGVGHCPQSNMKLASGVARVPEMLKAGVNVGLGSDGAASNNDVSIWEEMDSAAKLHKLHWNDPTVVNAKEALEMATIRGARAIHLEKEIGSLEAGKRADLIIVDINSDHQTPMYNIYSNLVYATKASDVETVMINGKPVMTNRRVLTIDEPRVKLKANFYRDKIRRSLAQ
ncbi:MAG: amidohydrolase [Acidobacteriota bacterium]